MITETLLGSITGAVFSHLAEKAEPKVRQWLGRASPGRGWVSLGRVCAMLGSGCNT